MKKIGSLLTAFLFLSQSLVLGAAPYKTTRSYSDLIPSLPNTTLEMNSADFWASQTEFPDRLILSPRAIEALNQDMVKKNIILDLTSDKFYMLGDALVQQTRRDFFALRDRTLFDVKKHKVPRALFDRLEAQLNLQAARFTSFDKIRYAIVTRMTDQRVVPSDLVLTAKPGDILFDELQNSSLDIGTPLLAICENASHEWVFTRGASSEGWVKKSDLAFCDRQAFVSYIRMKNFVVVTAPEARLYINPILSKYAGKIRMGARFSVIEKAAGDTIKVRIPWQSVQGNLEWRLAYLRMQDASLGYLPYTQRTLLHQAFKVLNRPYSWGGKGGEQDCSGFIMQLFATVGITLPRNSSWQAKTGTALATFQATDPIGTKLDALQKAVPGITLVYMQGHIMLFIGMIKGNPYCIHSTYSYARPESLGGKFILNRTVVSDLALGTGSAKGSHLERLKCLRVITLP